MGISWRNTTIMGGKMDMIGPVQSSFLPERKTNDSIALLGNFCIGVLENEHMKINLQKAYDKFNFNWFWLKHHSFDPIWFSFYLLLMLL